MAALLAALVGKTNTHVGCKCDTLRLSHGQLEKPEVFPSFLVDGKPPHPPVYVSLTTTSNRIECDDITRTFCIAAAGFRPKSPLCDSVFLPTFSTPTLHILGRTDVIVIEERSKTLLNVSAIKRVEYHDGGTHPILTCIPAVLI